MSKRMFQIIDDMNVADQKNKTSTVGVCPDFVRADKVKAGGQVTMGVPADALMNIMSGTIQPILLLLDLKDYNRRLKESEQSKTESKEQSVQPLIDALEEISDKYDHDQNANHANNCCACIAENALKNYKSSQPEQTDGWIDRMETSPCGKVAILFYNWMKNVSMTDANIPLEIKFRMFADQHNHELKKKLKK